MERAKYFIHNIKDEYFVKIGENNSIVLTEDINEAAELYYDDVEELIPLIESYTGKIFMCDQF